MQEWRPIQIMQADHLSSQQRVAESIHDSVLNSPFEGDMYTNMLSAILGGYEDGCKQEETEETGSRSDS